MAKQASPTLVGAFVVGAAALTIGGVLTFGSGDWLRAETTYVAYFEGSVSGLDVGAPIRFRGVELGNVTDIQAIWDAATEDLRIPVELTFIEGKDAVPPELREAYGGDEAAFMEHLIVDRGLRAVLQRESSVTGKLFVALELLPDEPLRRYGHPELQEIPSGRTGLDKLKKNLETLPISELIDQLITTVASVEEMIEDPEIDRVISNLNKLLENIDAQVVPLSESAQGTMEDARSLLQNVNVKLDTFSNRADELMAKLDSQVMPISESAQGTMDDARSLMQNTEAELSRVSSAVQETMNEAHRLLASLNESMEQEYTLYRVADLLDEAAGAARAIRALAEQLEREPEALLTGKDN